MKKWLKDKYKREGLVGTILVHILLLLLFIFIGLPYTIPRPEQGITVNFGTSDVGSGDVQPDTPGDNDSPDPAAETTPDPTPTSAVEEQVLTQDNEEAPEVPKTENPKKTEKEKPTETQKPEETPVEEKKVSDRLNQALQKVGNRGGGSEGDDDNKSGDKGQPDGVKDGGAYTGGGSGDGIYALGNRKALSKPKPVYNCTEEGTVVIEIKVNRAGETITTSVGRGTTNAADCLVSQAKIAAKNTKWQPDPSGPVEQVGKITYVFKLTQ